MNCNIASNRRLLSIKSQFSESFVGRKKEFDVYLSYFSAVNVVNNRATVITSNMKMFNQLAVLPNNYVALLYFFCVLPLTL